MKKAIRALIKAIVFPSLRIDRETITIGHRTHYTIAQDSITSRSIVVSAGVGCDIDFEIALCREPFNVKEIYLYDPSETAKKTIVSLDLPKSIHFFRLGIFATAESRYFDPQSQDQGQLQITQNPSPKSLVLQCTSIPEILRENNLKKIDLLKLDIEGAEYEVLESLLKTNIEVNQICVEFHDWMLDSRSRVDTVTTIWKLYRHGYRLIHRNHNDYTFILEKSSQNI